MILIPAEQSPNTEEDVAYNFSLTLGDVAVLQDMVLRVAKDQKDNAWTYYVQEGFDQLRMQLEDCG